MNVTVKNLQYMSKTNTVPIVATMVRLSVERVTAMINITGKLVIVLSEIILQWTKMNVRLQILQNYVLNVAGVYVGHVSVSHEVRTAQRNTVGNGVNVILIVVLSITMLSVEVLVMGYVTVVNVIVHQVSLVKTVDVQPELIHVLTQMGQYVEDQTEESVCVIDVFVYLDLNTRVVLVKTVRIVK